MALRGDRENKGGEVEGKRRDRRVKGGGGRHNGAILGQLI